MKVKGNGQAAILSPEQLRLLFTKGFTLQRDRVLFAICFYTACRISEALQLQRDDITETHILFRKANTKGKIESRGLRMPEPLALILSEYEFEGNYLFPSCMKPGEHLSRVTAHFRLINACKRLGFKGISTHSFRRTALTTMSNSGVPLRTIQKISGHKSLEQLEKYLDVTEEQMYDAASVLKF